MSAGTAKVIGVLGYLLVLLYIGFAASRRMKDSRDFFAAGKSLGFWSVAFSARATGESAWLLIGLTGMGAMVGVHAFWIVLGELLGVTAAWLIMSRRFKRLTDRYDSITMPDYLESRFSDQTHRIRYVSAFALVIFVTLYVSAQIDATGTAFETFLGWDYYLGAGVGFAVVLVYCTFGGFLAVAWSDVFQGALMFVGLVTLPIVGLYLTGGIQPMLSTLGTIDPHLLNWSGGASWDIMAVCSAISFALIGLGFLGSPQIFVRFLALRDESEIKKGATVAIVWTLLADSGAVVIGMVGRALFTGPGTDPESVLGKSAEGVLPQLVELALPSLLVGLFIAIVLSAIMSTIDSLLVVASSAIVRDVHQQIRHPGLSDEALMPLSRKVTIALAFVALAIALSVALFAEGRSVFWFVIFGWSGISATFCPTVILSLFWKRMTGAGALAAMLVGFVSVPIFKFLAPSLPVVGAYFAKLSELPPAFVCSFLAGIVVSLATKTSVPANAKADLAHASEH
ncbi:MAG: sodium/proline symporter [Myxococcota bacterium]|nr:sodium/proline symporter [Myxococcota bacterium]